MKECYLKAEEGCLGISREIDGFNNKTMIFLKSKGKNNAKFDFDQNFKELERHDPDNLLANLTADMFRLE